MKKVLFVISGITSLLILCASGPTVYFKFVLAIIWTCIGIKYLTEHLQFIDLPGYRTEAEELRLQEQRKPEKLLITKMSFGFFLIFMASLLAITDPNYLTILLLVPSSFLFIKYTTAYLDFHQPPEEISSQKDY